MLVKCINKGSYHITVGKIYDVSLDSEYYIIVNDIGYKHSVEKILFIHINIDRLNKINKLLC